MDNQYWVVIALRKTLREEKGKYHAMLQQRFKSGQCMALKISYYNDFQFCAGQESYSTSISVQFQRMVIVIIIEGKKQ